jgi:HD superfamily phosphohydrolase
MNPKQDIQKYKKTYQSFLDKVSEITKEYLQIHAGLEYHQNPSEKVINDPIWGCVKFNSWEIAIIDTPLYQRLRDIYQVGLGVFTYPSARHSRFEHSLGVTAIASRMIDSLAEQKSNTLQITPHEKMDVRLAALLHDIGHCFYSHLSESFYGTLPEFVDLLKYFNIKHSVRPKPHEIFSYLIINTNAFKEFLLNNRVLANDYITKSDGIDNLMQRIGNMIIGISNYGRKDEDKQKKKYSFLTKIINGDIDADKIDYIKRDSYTSGLPLSFDLERLLYKISVKENLEKSGEIEYQLVVDMSGITAVEEITFCKLMLNNYIYHHQKVLATEVMAKDIALALMNLKMVNHPVDFLRYTDKTIEALSENTEVPFNEYGCTYNLGSFVKRVKNRYLPKRCFEINSRVLETNYSEEERNKQEKDYVQNCLRELESTKDEKEKYEVLISFASDLFEFTDTHKTEIQQYTEFIKKFSSRTYEGYTKWIRNDIATKICEIYKKLKCELPTMGITVFDVHVVIPKSIDEQMVFSTPIVYRNSDSHPPTDMMSYTKNWAQAFNSNKWSGYVFVSPHIDTTIAFEATLAVLKEHIKGVNFTDPQNYVKRLNTELISEIEALS